jgi:tRNA (cmo5U34)-methyltransferase
MKIPENWDFNNKETVSCIDEHIPSELPWYPLALNMACFLARCYLGNGSSIIDLGCSTGAVTRHLSETINDRKVSCLSIDSSENMVSEFSGLGIVKCGDMRNHESIPEFDVAILMLSLMFTRADGRSDYLHNLEMKCRPGGAIIIVDKILIEPAYLNKNLGKLTSKLKFESGVNEADILKKDLSLCGIQRPTRQEDFFFNGYEKWFQAGEFAGYIKEVN